MLQTCLRKTIVNQSLLRLLSSATPKSPPIVTITVDGKKLQATEGSLLIDVIRQAGINVPTMCYHPDLKNSGGICRICLVEDQARNNALVISCRTPVQEGMQISTSSPRLAQLRQTNTVLMSRTHPSTCLSCPQNTRCELQKQASNSGISSSKTKEIMHCPREAADPIDKSTALVRNMDLCIGCDRCVQACRAQCGAYEWTNTGSHSIETFGSLKTSDCIQCGQCVNVCPTGALQERSEIEEVLKALSDPEKHVVFQLAPAIRVSIGEEFGLKPGEKLLKNELVTALKMLGKNVTVLDTDFSADLTIMEEAAELVERMSRRFLGKKHLSEDEKFNTDLPMFTSCCPAWVSFMEKNYPDMLPHMSTCKSPMQMQSALIKTYWATKIKGIDPKKVVSVAIMPCIAKKEEKDRCDMVTDEYKWTDYVWTTREFGKVLRQAGIDPTKLPKTDFDKAMGISSGAGVIFAATGGVLEAALRTAYEMITGRPVPFKNLEITPIRGMEGIREAKFKLENVRPEFAPLEGFECKVAVAHQIGNAKTVVEMIKAAKQRGEDPPWHLVEVMTCPGGCLGGGGQPKPTTLDVRKARASLIYSEDRNLPIRKSHENPEIKEVYEKYLEHPLSHKSHELLHREYTPFKDKYTYTFNPEQAKGIGEILDKYEKNHPEYLLPIVIDETDRKGYLSGASIVKIAEHLGLSPMRVAAVVSHYHYFPRKKTSDTHMYVCMCHNCVMHGQEKNYAALEKIGKGSFELHKMNWLGVCINDAPAAMVKRTGTDYVEYLMGMRNPGSLGNTMKNLSKNLVKTPPNNIKLYPFSRLKPGFDYASMLEPLPEDIIDDSIKTAFKIGGDAVIQKLMNAKLEGRGGAGFPTWKKWDAVRKTQGKEKFFVCNADEGLPSTFKDWYILSNENARRRVISGMAICAKTVGAQQAYIYLRYEYRNLVPDLVKTISEVKKAHPEISEVDFKIRLGGGPYVAGEETSQFESIQGAPPIPRKDRPWNVFATSQGLFYSPTVINNVETFFAVPYIIHHQEENIARAGLPKLLGVTGDVSAPAMLEYALHAQEKPTLNKIIKEIDATDIIAAEVGGATEPLVFKKDFDKPIGFGWGVQNAVGSFVLFGKGRNLKDVYLRKLEFMADESCKQCVPCRDGSKVLRDAIKSALRGDYRKVSKETLKRVADAAAMTSICAHGKALGPLFTAAYDYVMESED